MISSNVNLINVVLALIESNPELTFVSLLILNHFCFNSLSLLRRKNHNRANPRIKITTHATATTEMMIIFFLLLLDLDDVKSRLNKHFAVPASVGPN